MIEKLLFVKDYRNFKKGSSVSFKRGLNLLVGDQGSGKSTILMALATHGRAKSSFCKRDQYVKEASFLLQSESRLVFSHDFENDFERIAPAIAMMGMVSQKKLSHGQVTQVLIDLTKEIKNGLIILDEPDANVSNRTAMKLIDALKTMDANGCQVIASIHHPWVIEAFSEVYSVEHRIWMESKKFLDSQKHAPTTPLDPTEEEISMVESIKNSEKGA